MQQSFPIRFKRGVAIGAEFRARFDCENEPTLSPDGLQVTGTSGFAVILGHEYLFRDAYISDVELEQYPTEDCQQTTRYRFILEFFVSDQLLFGFSYNGFGVAIPYRCRSRKFTARFDTDEFCCDLPSRDLRGFERQGTVKKFLERLIPAALATPFFAAGTALSLSLGLVETAQEFSSLFSDLLYPAAATSVALLAVSLVSALRKRPVVEELEIQEQGEIGNI